MIFYFTFENALRPGEIILPGRWGAICRNNTPNGGSVYLLREWILENIRLRFYPDRPSRLQAVFLCSTLHALIAFRSENYRHNEHAYRVELVSPDRGIFITDYKFFGMSEWDKVETLEIKAHLYWQGGKTATQEVLSLSAIRIVAEITESELREEAQIICNEMNAKHGAATSDSPTATSS